MKRFLAMLLLASGLASQTLAGETPANAQDSGVRYSQDRPNPLPIAACEFHALAAPRPYHFKMPVKVTIRLLSLDAYKNGTAFQQLPQGPVVFQGVLDKPKKLESGYYVIEAEGEKEPIYVAYDVPDEWQFYQIYRLPGPQYMGPFLAPGYSHLQAGQYKIYGFRFQHDIECRNNETATFDVPVYEKLPDFLVPTIGTAW